MKAIEFGYDNSIEPTGSYEGIGIRPGLMLCDAQYIGTIMYEGNHYMIAKAIKDTNGNYPELLGKFVVREALYDVYPDGSGVYMIEQEENETANNIATFLNNPAINDKIDTVEDVYDYISEARPALRIFKLAEIDDIILCTAITSEAFEIKNNAIKNCHASFSQIGMETQQYTK